MLKALEIASALASLAITLGLFVIFWNITPA